MCNCLLFSVFHKKSQKIFDSCKLYIVFNGSSDLTVIRTVVSTDMRRDRYHWTTQVTTHEGKLWGT
jgi:hypothetical protein